MSAQQVKSVRSRAAHPKALESGALSSVAPSRREGERTRVMKDGTHLSFEERLDYAMSLVPASSWQAKFGRSRKQMLRYLQGADVPISVINMVAAHSGVPTDWIVGGRPSFGPSDFDLWRLSLPSPDRFSVPTSPDPQHPDDFRHRIEKHTEIIDFDAEGRPVRYFPDQGADLGTQARPSEVVEAASQPGAGAGASVAPPARELFRQVDIDRLTDAYTSALQALASHGHRDPEPRRLLQIMVLFYDELTEAEAVQRQGGNPSQRP